MDETIKYITCTKCKTQLPPNAFGKRKAVKSGLKSWCKKCEAKAQKQRRAKNPEKYRKAKEKYRNSEQGKAVIKAYNKQYHQKHKKTIRENAKKLNSTEEKRKLKRKAAARHRRKKGIPPRIKQSNEERRRKNREYMAKIYQPKKTKSEIREYKRKWHRERKRNNLNYRITCNLRKRIWDALKGHVKSKATQELIGCTIAHLKSHIEGLFTEGMYWDNYGSWHIDHIIPCAAYDLSCQTEQEKCFHYTNLQPLWALDNFKKGAKITIQ